jgi:hypothetical protein
MNHDARACLSKDVFHELVGEPAQSVSVTDHNDFDASLEYSVQKGRKAFALPVESRSGIADELVAWVGIPEVLLLSLEVPGLVGRGDPSIADPGSPSFLLRVGVSVDGIDA